MDINKFGSNDLLKNKIKKCIISFPHFIVLIFFPAVFVSFVSNKTILWTFSGNIQLWYIYISVIIAGSALLFIIFKFLNNYFQFKNISTNIISIVLVCLIPRIICINIVNIIPISDFETYHVFASELCNGNTPGSMYISIFPHTIGYPAVLSIFYRIFGAKVLVAQMLNIVLSCGIAILIYILGRKLHSSKCGLISAIIWSLWPSQVFYVSLVSTEALFVFLNLLCIIFFINIAESRLSMKISFLLFAFLGALCAFANSIRPMALITLTGMCIYLILYTEKTPGVPYDEALNVYRTSETYKGIKNYLQPKIILSLRHKELMKIPAIIIILISYLITTKTIQAAISNTIDRSLPSKPFGYSFYIGTNYDANGIWNQDDANTLGELMNNPNMTPQLIHDTLSKMAVERLKGKSTLQTVKLIWGKFSTMWAADSDFVMYMEHAVDKKSPSVFDFFRYERLLIKTANLYYHIFMIIAGVGNFFLVLRRKSYYSMICMIILGYMFAHFFLEVAGRYHYPVISLISLLSGYGLVCFSQFLDLGQKTEAYI